MKTILFLILPALAFAVPEKRFVLDSLLTLVDGTTIRKDLQLMIDVIGNDATEQACEQAGHQYLKGLLDHSVPLICHSFQELVHHFHIVPDTTITTPVHVKRYLLDDLLKHVDLTTIRKDLQLMIDVIGNDATEQACEQAGHQYLKGLLDHSVPLICHSFQELVHHFHIVPDTTITTPVHVKRYLLDDLLKHVDLTTIRKDLQLMIDVIGNDATEQACEQAGHQYLKGLLDHSVPLICHSFQELVHHFHIVPDTTAAAPGKRYLLDSFAHLLDIHTLKADLQKLVDVIGSDASEQACEHAAHTYFSGLVDAAVPLMCQSFKELVNHFHIVPDTTATAPGKRYLLDSFAHLLDIHTLKADLQKLVDVIGSDASEQACEQYAHTYFSGLADAAVPLMCQSFKELVKHFHIVPAATAAAPAQ